jgi:integrase
VNLLVDQRLAPATVNAAVTALKMLVKREWNSTVIDAPPIDPDAQDAPVIGGRELNVALSRADRSSYQAYYVLAAGSGLRMGEMLALRMGPDRGEGSVLDLEQGVIFVRSAVYDRQERATKRREVDLCTSLVTWLEQAFNAKQAGERIFTTKCGDFWHLATLYDHFATDGIPGSHSLRRFRTTHLENMSVPRVLVDYWIGRASKAITGIDARKDWCRRAGLGFQLPMRAVPAARGHHY